MEYPLLSTVKNAPPGFKFQGEIKPKDIRRRVFALFTDNITDFERQYGHLFEKIAGVIITLEREIFFRNKSPGFFHLGIPEYFMSDLHEIVYLYLCLVDSLQFEKNENKKHSIELERARADYYALSDYFSVLDNKIRLEQLVAERTAELRAANEKLQREIVERKKAEEDKARLESELRHAQKMQAIGTLAGGIAHHFNNLLHAISGYIQLLSLKKKPEDPDRKYLDQIDHSVQRAAQLVKQLLTFSRKMESAKRLIDLNKEIKRSRDLLERTIPKMINIDLELAEDLRPISADATQLDQIILNLASNACDAMPEGGHFLLKTENIDLDEEYCRHHVEVKPGSYVLFSISDTGSGMDQYTLDHIFEPYFTAKEIGKGTGLGLATVFGIVKNHGGHLTCDSKVGQGTTFRIYLPAATNATKMSKEIPKAEVRGGNETILLVDDEASILEIGQAILKQFGYRTLTAQHGEEALEIYRDAKEDIDLIILDLGMPGMGGRRCLGELLKIDPNVKVIIASGYSAEAHARDTLEMGAVGFINKPYSLRDILKKVRKALDESA